MKRIFNYSIYLFSVAVLFSACRKEDNPAIPELTRFPLPQLAKVAGTDQVISAQSPSTFSGKFTVGLYYPNDIPPRKFDVAVMKNNDKTNVKILKADIQSFPAEVTVTGPELENLFGAPIVLGDKFDISVNVTTFNGENYEAFPVVGNSYASGIAAQPGSNTLVRYEAVCQYVPSVFQGQFEVVTDEWADYGAGDLLTLTMIDETHFSFQFLPDNPQPIVVTVNPVTNAVTVAKQVYGSGYGAGWPYGNISAESIPSVDNFVAPCTGVFSVVLKHTVGAGSFGEFKLVLKKE